MASLSNLVKQTSTSTGTGNFTLAAATGGFQTFAGAFSTGVTTDVFYYFIIHTTSTEWECGTGHMSDSATLVRDTVIASSNGGSLVSFTAGDKVIDCDLPASVQSYLINLNGTSTGILTQTSATSFARRTITAGTGISVTNGNGVSGNPTIASTITQYTDDLARDAVGANLLTTTSITPIYSGGYFSWYFTGHVPSGLFFDSKNKFNLTADINELDISGVSINFITPDNDGWYIRGIRTDVAGHEVRLINASDSYFFFLSNEDPSSEPSYQMLLPYTEVKIPPRQGVILIWDKDVNKWRLSDTVSLQTISGTSPIAVDNTDPENPIVSMTQASGSVDGYLSSTDWTTFNGKVSFTDELAQDAIGTILTDTATINFTYSDATPSITADVITNAGDKQVLYQNGSAIDGMAGLVSDANGAPVVVEDITLTAPSSGVQLYSKSTSGRRMLGQKEVTADDYRFQPFLGDHVCRYWFPYGGGVTTLYAGGLTIAYTGSTNAVTPATTTYFTSRNRINNLSGATAGSSATGRHNGLIVTRGDAAGIGGFYWTFEGGNADAATVANGRMFAGLYGTNSAIGNVATNSLLNMVGFGWDTGDGNIQFYTNDGSGTASKTDLGSTFPANTLSVDWYKFEIWCAPNASTIYWKCTRKNTGDVTSGSVSSDLPTNTVYMAPQVWINNGTTALARTFAYGPMYLECFT